MESFFDTMLVNGTPYPTQKVGQKVYRLRILNGSNDRHLNLSLFYAKSNADMWKRTPPPESSFSTTRTPARCR